MQQMLIEIMDNYLKAKEEPFGGHAIADYIRNIPKDIIEKETDIDLDKYKIEASPGKGNWAQIPWIAVFDNDITDTATKGYYIVYLFCADMSGVYLSLNQGWTYFKDKYKSEGKKKIRVIADAWKKVLSSSTKDFSFDSIELKDSNKSSSLSKGYELGHICGRFYEKGKIPSSEELVADLKSLLSVYSELKNEFIGESLEKTNNHLIVNNELGIIESIYETQDSYMLDSVIEDYQNSFVVLEDVPEKINCRECASSFIPQKIDFFEKAKVEAKIGLAGELMVLKYERDRLTALGEKSLAKKVEHTSKVRGDGAGYDILSYNQDGNKRYIEVKTTTESKDSTFFLTSNEVEFSKQNKENYYLYRVFNFSDRDNTGSLYIISGDLSKTLEFEPLKFVVSRIREVKY